MWIAVIVSLFLSSFCFYLLTLYHHTIQAKDFASITSASTNSKSEFTLPADMDAFTRYRNAIRRKWRRKWKRLNRERHFFKKFHAEHWRKKHMWRRNFHRLMTSPPPQPDDQPENLYIFQQLINSFLYTFGMIMNVSLPRMPTVWTVRMFMGCWWLYCILLSNTYRASLTAILANPVPR